MRILKLANVETGLTIVLIGYVKKYRTVLIEDISILI